MPAAVASRTPSDHDGTVPYEIQGVYPPRCLVQFTLHHNALGSLGLRMRRDRTVVGDVPHKLLDPMVHLRRVLETRFTHERRDAVSDVVS